MAELMRKRFIVGGPTPDEGVPATPPAADASPVIVDIELARGESDIRSQRGCLVTVCVQQIVRIGVSGGIVDSRGFEADAAVHLIEKLIGALRISIHTDLRGCESS